MIPFEFVIKGPPVTLQAKKKSKLNAWKKSVTTAAKKAWPNASVATNLAVQMDILSIYTGFAADADNIVKPIQDSLNNLVYNDDTQIMNVSSRKREKGRVTVTNPTPILAKALDDWNDVVYIKVTFPGDLTQLQV